MNFTKILKTSVCWKLIYFFLCGFINERIKFCYKRVFSANQIYTIKPSYFKIDIKKNKGN